MKKVEVNLFSFEELSESAQLTVIERERYTIQEDTMDCFGYDYRATLEKFSEIFGITFLDWRVSDCGHSFSFKFKNPIYDWNWDCLYANEVSGKLLLRYLNGVYIKKAYSKKNKYVQPFDPSADCPLTGCCYDYDILQPIVDWYKKPDYDISLYSLIEKCLENFFQAWEDEYEYCASDEFCRQELTECSRYENTLYYSDGTKADKYLQNVA